MFPSIEPYQSGHLQVSPLHSIYFEECGNPEGIPILFLHGGPGSGCDSKQRSFFDPQIYRVILFDQRGSGRSIPYASLKENTTWDLVEDIEKLRKHAGIDSWIVFGGSWGSTLALSYAITHPKQVVELILRGIFLCREEDINWFYRQGGASRLFPEEWQRFLEPLTIDEKKDPFLSHYHLLSSDEDTPRRQQSAAAWIRWEGSCLKLETDAKTFNDFVTPERTLALARIESHYFYHGIFFQKDNFLVEKAAELHMPCTIVHGRYDVLCPVDGAIALKKAMPQANLIIVPNAGHSAYEPGILKALLKALERSGN